MTDSVSLSIVEALADAEGVEPGDLDYTLEAHIDTDALAQLASHSSASWTLSFEVPDHEVTVEGDGRVLVDGYEKATWARSSTSAINS